MSRKWIGWAGQPSFLSYPGEDTNTHCNKEPRSAQIGEWLSTLTSQPKFATLGPSCSQALALVYMLEYCCSRHSRYGLGLITVP